MRGAAILVGVELIERFHSVIYVLGATLLRPRLADVPGRDEDVDPSRSRSSAPCAALPGDRRPSRAALPHARGRPADGRRRCSSRSRASWPPTSPSRSTRSRRRSRSPPTRSRSGPRTRSRCSACARCSSLVEELIRRFRYLDETIAIVLGIVGVKLLIEDLVQVWPVAEPRDRPGGLRDRHHRLGDRRPPRPRGRGRSGRRLRSRTCASPGHVAVGAWSGGRYLHFGEPLDDERLDALLRPGDGHRHGAHRRRLRRRGGRRGCSAARWRGVDARRASASIGRDRPRLLRGRARRRQGLPALHRPAPARGPTATPATCGWRPSARSSASASTPSTCCCCTTPTARATRATRSGTGMARGARRGPDARARRRAGAGQRLHARRHRLLGALRRADRLGDGDPQPARAVAGGARASPAARAARRRA